MIKPEDLQAMNREYHATSKRRLRDQIDKILNRFEALAMSKAREGATYAEFWAEDTGEGSMQAFQYALEELPLGFLVLDPIQCKIMADSRVLWSTTVAWGPPK